MLRYGSCAVRNMIHATEASPQKRRRSVGAAPPFELGYVTDVEGDRDYWQRYLEHSSVLRRAPSGELELTHPGAHFVFGGDVVDKGPGDVRLARELVALKRRYPARVRLLVGNRDLNKLRFAAELSPADLSRSHQTIPRPHWDPRAPSLSEHLAKVAAERGCEPAACDTAVERLRWTLLHTLGCPNTFEYRRQELAELEGKDPGAVGDDAVLCSMQAEARPGGSLWEYMSEAEVGAIVGNTLFVHGAVDARNAGFVPCPKRTRFERPSGPQPGTDVTDEGVAAWVRHLNDFLRAGLADAEARPNWDPERRTRGGEQLMALQNRTAMWGRTVVSNCYSDGGVITNAEKVAEGAARLREADDRGDPLLFEGIIADACDPTVAAWLRRGGIFRVVVGHKPSGDCPAVLSAGRCGLEIVSADTSFSGAQQPGAAGPRGEAVAAVIITGSSAGDNQLRLRGVLRDGRRYDTLLPPLPPRARPADDPCGGDALVGAELPGGWWVKVRTDSGEYLLCRGEGRSVEYRYVASGSAELSQARM
eukprot:TRINITY_DN60646_c0_g1_i1.p1 TRINITY_DN60646_c0_g1~~TRINITY_DN60646_c0_g1_i1.p1  ORF type:complete len:534 (+),score=99.79 TRINITY_DN60646_c0_g1_i1:59-1660(+)